MNSISVKLPSAKSLAKLKRGLPVRLAKGEGLELVVNPAQYNHITKSFIKGKGVNVALSPEEVAENHGKGIFDSLKKGVSAVGHAVAPVASKVASKASDILVDKALQHGEKALNNYLSGEGTRKGMTRKTARRAYEDLPSQMGGALDTDILNKINELTGQKLGALAKNSVVQAGARTLRGNMEGAFAKALQSAPTGYGLYASPPSGMGIRPMERRHTNIGGGGNLLGMPPALMSQPYSANFQFASRLPPAYQSQIRSGAGLY